MIPFLIVSLKEFKKIFLCTYKPIIYFRAFIAYIILTGLMYSLYFGYYETVYVYLTDYVKNSDNKSYFEWINFGVLVGIYLFISCVTIIFTKFPEKQKEKDTEQLSKVAVLITCHNSEDVIINTIEKALHTFLPEQIYIADNNNSPNPITDTMKNICQDYGINYLYFPVGCKGNAIKEALTLIDNKYKYIMTLDDDTLLPEDFNPTFSYFDNERVSSIAFGIKMIKKDNLSERFANFEYILNSLRFYFDNYTTNKFIIGIAGLWKRDILSYIINNNPTAMKASYLGKDLDVFQTPYGEDSFNGLINRLLGYKSMMDINNFVESYAPPRLFYTMNELLCRSTSHISGYNSLNHYSQRAMRWYRSPIVKIPSEIYLLLTYNASDSTDNLFHKIWKNVVYRLIIIFDMVLLYFAIFLAYNIVLLIKYEDYILWGIFQASIYVCGIINNCLINYYTLRNKPELQIGIDIVLLYPFFTGFVLICRFVGFVGALLWYIPFNTPLCYAFCKFEIMCRCLTKNKPKEDDDIELGYIRTN